MAAAADSIKVLLLLLLVVFTISQLLPSASCSPPPSSTSTHYYCDWCRRHSTASSLSPPAAAARAHRNDGGACGYGDYYSEVHGGGAPHVAAAGAQFFRDGAGCGACYQLRCRDRRLCGDDGVRVVVTNAAADRNRTGFLLTREAFAAMAKRGMADQLAAMDNVHVDFRRVPCEYEKNLTVRVEEGSWNPDRLAIRFLYQGGQTDIAAVEIAQAATKNNHTQASSSSLWRPMARLRRRAGGGAVWVSRVAPGGGPLQLRLVVTAGFGGKWLRAGEEAVLPADWRPGQAYDTGIRVTDVAMRTCARSCGGGGQELR